MDAHLPTPQSLTAEDLSGRTGFDEHFLSLSVPIPTLEGVATVLLSYTNFSVLMRPDKRLAAITALGIDGEKLMDIFHTGID